MHEECADWVVLGRIQGVFGLAGLVKVYSYTETPADILKYPSWWLRIAQDRRCYRLVGGQTHGKTLLAALEGVADRDRAQALVGYLIEVPRTQLPALPQGEYYWSQLLGLRVINREGEVLGTVDSLFETGANDVVVVKAPNGEEILIPYLDPVIIRVDLDAHRLDVDWQVDY